MTITLRADDVLVEQATKQLYKIIDVLKVQDVTDEPTVQHELALVKVRATDRTRGELISIVEMYKARIVDMAPESVIVETTGHGVGGRRAHRAPPRLRDQGDGADRDRRDVAGRPVDRGGHQAMTAKMYYDADADPAALAGQTVAIIGFGSQGHAHALNLHESGVRVVVGPAGGLEEPRRSPRRPASRCYDTGEAVARGRRGDDRHPGHGPEGGLGRRRSPPTSSPGTLVLFAHGFNIRFGRIAPPEGVDVGMVAPKGPGHLVRSVYESGGGVPALFAVHQDATGHGPCPRPRLRARRSAAPAPGSSRRRSRKRPRPTCSASRASSAAARRPS